MTPAETKSEISRCVRHLLAEQATFEDKAPELSEAVRHLKEANFWLQEHCRIVAMSESKKLNNA